MKIKVIKKFFIFISFVILLMGADRAFAAYTIDRRVSSSGNREIWEYQYNCTSPGGLIGCGRWYFYLKCTGSGATSQVSPEITPGSQYWTTAYADWTNNRFSWAYCGVSITGGCPFGSSGVVTIGNCTTPTLNFWADSTSLPYNGSTTLRWSSSNAESCTASGAWSRGKVLSGAESTGSLTSSKTYTLACSSLGGTVTRSVAVNVSPPASCALPWGGTIAHGSGVTAYQSGSVPCGSSCASQTRTCNNGVLSGSYTNQSCTVAACVPTCSSSWSPAGPLTSPASSIFFWNSTNATSATYSCSGIIAGSGATATAGSLPLSFSAGGTQNCSVTVIGPGGSATCPKSITVNSGPPTVTLTATPSSINNGESSIITWSSTNASSCAVAWTASAATSGFQSVSPSSTTNYSMTCTGLGGTGTGSAIVTVNCVDQCLASSCSGDVAQICGDGNGDGCKEITGTIDCSTLGSNYSCVSGSCVCTPNNPNCTADNICEGQTCNNGCYNINGNKNCSSGDENWREVAP